MARRAQKKDTRFCKWDWSDDDSQGKLVCIVHPKKHSSILRLPSADEVGHPVIDPLISLYRHEKLTGQALEDAKQLAEDCSWLYESEETSVSL